MRIVLYYPSYIYNKLDSGSSDWGLKIGVMTSGRDQFGGVEKGRPIEESAEPDCLIVA